MNKKSAIFLDRDGVINKERKDYVKSLEELEIFPQVIQPIKKFNELGYLIIVITNQSAINRGFTTHENIIKIHQYIQEFLMDEKARIDDFYYCPHRPEENCICRKPKPGMLLKAIKDHNIDINTSWMIGDCDKDVLAGKCIGCNTIKINAGFSLIDAMKLIAENQKNS